MIRGDVEYLGANDVVLTELMGIQQRDGALAPERVVESAASPESPLHGFFEWNNDAAAHQYRLVQARSLVQRVTVRLMSAPNITTRAFVSIERTDDSRRYELVTNGPEILERRRLQLVADLASLQERLSEFEEFAKAAQMLSEVIAAL